MISGSKKLLHHGTAQQVCFLGGDIDNDYDDGNDDDNGDNDVSGDDDNDDVDGDDDKDDDVGGDDDDNDDVRGDDEDDAQQVCFPEEIGFAGGGNLGESWISAEKWFPIPSSNLPEVFNNCSKNIYSYVHQDVSCVLWVQYIIPPNPDFFPLPK